MTRRRRITLVRYVSPFGSPAWMTPDLAERYYREDYARYLRFTAIGIPLPFAPRIERKVA